ncbi:MAG: type II toxin-antitoxin system death-on-curing family toxin [Hyphomicrobiaceae bacterium]
MNDPIWLSVEDVIGLHSEQLAIFGGPSGLRDLGMLESALTRAINRWNYGETDLAALAACYAFGIAKNQLFVDGNKRAAFAAMMVFLRVNEVSFSPDPALAAAAILGLAAGEIDEDGLARWIRDNWPDGA